MVRGTGLACAPFTSILVYARLAVLALITVRKALDLFDHSQPIFTDDHFNILRRGDPSDRVHEQRIPACILRDAAAAPEHVQTYSDMVGTDQIDDVVDKFRPFVRGRNRSQRHGIVATRDEDSPRPVSGFLIHTGDEVPLLRYVGGAN